MGKIGKKKNKKNNGRFGGTNCVPILLFRHAASTKSGPVCPEIASIELGFKGTWTVPVFLVLNLAAGLRSSRVSIVCRWSCSQIGGAMYVIHADDALDSLIADVHSRGALCVVVYLSCAVSSSSIQNCFGHFLFCLPMDFNHFIIIVSQLQLLCSVHVLVITLCLCN